MSCNRPLRSIRKLLSEDKSNIFASMKNFTKEKDTENKLKCYLNSWLFPERLSWKYTYYYTNHNLWFKEIR